MRALKTLSVFSILGILALAFFSWYSCDDFCYRVLLSKHTVAELAWFNYLNWDGRCISPVGLIQFVVLKYLPVEVATLTWAVSFVGSAILVFKIIRIENNLFFRSNHAVIGVAVIAATMWLGMWKLIPDIIYWATGGWYSLFNLLGMCWLYIFLSGLKLKHVSRMKSFNMFFISFTCGANSHNFVVALIFLAVIEFVEHYYVRRNKPLGVFISASLAGLIAGALFIYLAPGNLVRLHLGMPAEGGNNFLYAYFLVLSKYLYWLLSLFFIVVFWIWLSGSKIHFKKSDFYLHVNAFSGSFRNSGTFFGLIYRQKYFLAAMSTIVFFSASLFAAVPRTAIFFATFMIIYFFQRNWKVDDVNLSKRFVSGSILFLSLFICTILFQGAKAWTLKKEFAERGKLFLSAKGKDVTVPVIQTSRIPFAFSFTDVSGDSSYWVNRCVAEYYELKTIKTGPDE